MSNRCSSHYFVNFNVFSAHRTTPIYLQFRNKGTGLPALVFRNSFDMLPHLKHSTLSSGIKAETFIFLLYYIIILFRITDKTKLQILF